MFIAFLMYIFVTIIKAKRVAEKKKNCINAPDSAL